MSFTILFVVVKNWTKGGCTLSRGRQMAKRNTPENLRVVNSEQKGRPSWGIRFVLQQLVITKTFAAFFRRLRSESERSVRLKIWRKTSAYRRKTTFNRAAIGRHATSKQQGCSAAKPREQSRVQSANCAPHVTLAELT